VSAKLLGGLGNQLFIVAAAYGYARRHGISYGIYMNTIEHSPHSAQPYEWTIFKNILKFHSIPPTFTYTENGCRCICYDTIPQYDTQHLHLIGYFQSEKYLEGCAAEFLDLLEFPQCDVDDPDWYSNACFIHIRRGDYLKWHLHNVDLWTRYYPSAIARMQELHRGVNFLICSDDIPWCEAQPFFRDAAATGRLRFLREKDEVKSMLIMSQCRIGGICANSSFSWWSAFKNKNPQKTVIFPAKWFNNDWPNQVAFQGSLVMEV